MIIGEPGVDFFYCMITSLLSVVYSGGGGSRSIRVLTARKLLILRMARGAKKAPLPIPLYVYCTKIFSRFDP
jgi:hypothetical protein